MKIAIIGKGNVGRNLGTLCEAAGHIVVYGGRDNLAQVVTSGDMLILAIPYTSVKSIKPTIENSITNKILIDATNALKEDWSPLEETGESKSAGEEIQRLFPNAKVVKAFNTVFADNMVKEHMKDQLTTFVAGDDEKACTQVVDLASSIGMYPVLTGPLLTARYLEAVAHLNIQLAVGMGHGTRIGFTVNSFDRTGNSEK